MPDQLINDANVTKAITICERSIPHYDSYSSLFKYSLAILDKYYDKTVSTLDKKDMGVCLVLYDYLKHGKVSNVENQFGTQIAAAVFQITEFQKDEHPLRTFEVSFREYDMIYLKMVIRLSKIYCCIQNSEREQFVNYIDQYAELRRKLMKKRKEKSLIELLNFESDLIKFGRRYFSGKPADSFDYEYLIVT